MACLELRGEGLATDVYLVIISLVTDGLNVGHAVDSSRIEYTVRRETDLRNFNSYTSVGELGHQK